MCGRFLLTSSMDEVIKRYNIIKVDCEDFALGEVFPGNSVLMIQEDGARSVQSCKWGFFISALKKQLINIRYETIGTKHDFRPSFYSRRCIIPANAFYEWKNEGTHKKKYKFSLSDLNIISLAGIYNQFIDQRGNAYTGLGIITVPSGDRYSTYHHRMPLIISKEKENIWLSANTNKIMDEVKEVFINKNINYIVEPADKEIQLSLFN
jgi:putative SOS response-associated peptidase YedK